MKREKTLIVGPQGSGKTTLANNMMKGLNEASKKHIRACGITKFALRNLNLKGFQCVNIVEFVSVRQLKSYANRFALAKVAVIYEYQGYLQDIPVATRELFDEIIDLGDSPM